MGSINKAVQTFPKPLNFHDQVSAEMMPVGSITSESDRGDSDPSPVKTEPASADGRNLENVPDQCIDELSETDSSVSSGSITIGYVPSALPDNMSLSPPAYQGVAIEFSPPSAGVSVTGSSDQKQTYTVETISRWSESSGSSGAPLASIPRDINASHSTPLLEHCSLKDSPSAESQGNQSDKRDDMPSDRTKYTYTYPEFQSNATTVIIGGFGPLPKQHNENDRMPIGAFFRKFPPPSNKDYEYTTHARDPKFVYNPPKPVIPCKPPSRTAPSGSVVQQEVIRPQPSFPTRNDTNNKKEEARWRRNAIGLLPLGLSDNATDEERKYVFNEAYNVIDQPHGHCWRCDCVHIEFGPPDTLPTRDTCGAYLPGWFPAEQYQNCWKDFEGLWRDIIYLEESQRSFASTVSEVEQQQPISDKCFHAKDSKWRDMHPNSEGFWRCRNGPEATDAELSCVECHVPKRQESPDQPRNRYYYVKRNALIKWVYGCMKHMGLDDEAAAEAIVTRLGVDRITNYPYFPGTGERARESRIMPENLTLNMPEFESDGDNKGKALEILGNMPYPVGYTLIFSNFLLQCSTHPRMMYLFHYFEISNL
jgi:hypothetical protein